MTTFFIVKIDNNLSYEDNYVETKYFSSYVDAYNYVLDDVYDITNFSGDYESYNTYSIGKVEVGDAGNTTNTLISQWLMGKWYTFTSKADADEFFEASTDKPWNEYNYIHNDSTNSNIWNSIENHNGEIVNQAADEIEGYKAFCAFTLALPYAREYARLFALCENNIASFFEGDIAKQKTEIENKVSSIITPESFCELLKYVNEYD